MNPLIPLGLIAGAAYLATKKSAPVPPTSTPKSPYFKDCDWICGIVDFSTTTITKEFEKTKKLIEPLFEKYKQDQDFGILRITQELMNPLLKNCKLKGDQISNEDSFTIRYIFSGKILSTALFLALSEKIEPMQLSVWLLDVYPLVLKSLGLLIIGDSQINVMKMRFASITDFVIKSNVDKLFIVNPEFKKLQPETLATLLLIQFTQIVHTEQKNKCEKIIDAQYADYSQLSGQFDPFFMIQYKRLVDAFISANSK